MPRQPLLRAVRASLPRVLSVLLALLAVASPAAAQRAPDAAAWRATSRPELTARRAPGPITVDGLLDDPGWRDQPRAEHFAEHQPGDQVQPPVDTVVHLTYDDDYLYAAWICYDDPAAVRATFTERDRIWSDDYVILAIDTFASQGWAYEIAANPYGVQGDLLWSANHGEDMTYDLVFHTAGRITDAGWQVEMAIPWTSLRFPDRDEQVWRVDFWRNHPREVRGQYSWAEYDRDESCWPCQWGTVRGIRGVRPGSGLEILPAYVASQEGARDRESGDFANGDLQGEPSLGLAYGIGPTTTAEATLNPDFSQVESDAAQIDINSAFALSYAEKRPFFQEGSDLWSTWFDVVYTRSINRPLWAAKTTGRPGDANFAVLTAQDDATPFLLPFEEGSALLEGGRSWSTLGRYRQTLGEQSHLGAIVTDRRHEGGGSGTTFGADTRLRLGRTTALEVQVLASRTAEPDDPTFIADSTLAALTFDRGRHTAAFDGEEYWGHALYASFERDGRNLSLDLTGTQRSPTYRAENGFEPRNDQRQVTASTSYTWFLDGHPVFDRIGASTFAGRVWNFADVKKDEWVGVNGWTHLRWAQAYLQFQHMQSNELYHGVRFDHIFLNSAEFQLNPAEAVRGGANWSYGHRIARRHDAMGGETNYGGWVDLKPVSNVLWENSFSYVRSRDVVGGERLFKDWVARSRLNLQLSREWSVRLVLQYVDSRRVWDADPLLTWRLNPFSIFYVGSTRSYAEFSPDPDDRDAPWRLMRRTYFLKLQYLFQI